MKVELIDICTKAMDGLSVAQKSMGTFQELDTSEKALLLQNVVTGYLPRFVTGGPAIQPCLTLG